MRFTLLMLLICFSCVKPQPIEPIQLSLPSKTSPFEERLSYYIDNRVTQTKIKVVTIENPNTHQTVSYNYIDVVRLNNGKKINSSKALSDAFPGTALEKHYNTGKKLIAQTAKPRRHARIILIAGFIGTPLLIPPFLGILGFNVIHRDIANTERNALREFDLIYLSFNEVLREQLGICTDPSIVTIDGDALVECIEPPQ